MPLPMESGQGESVAEDPDPDAILHVSREARGGAVHLSTYALEIKKGHKVKAVGVNDPVKKKLLGLAWIETSEQGEYIETQLESTLCAEPFSTREKLMSRLINSVTDMAETDISSAVIRTPWQPSSESFMMAAKNVFGNSLNLIAAEIGENIEIPARPTDNVRRLGAVAGRELVRAA